MSRAVRGTLRILALVLGVGLLAAPAAHAIQASGSLEVIPSNSGPLENGQTITVKVIANNTSTNTPSAPPAPPDTSAVPAVLSGPLSVDFGCLPDGCLCTVQDTSGRLTFMPGAANGCDTKDAAVTGCSAGPGTTALIDLGAAGITIPPDGSVELATIKLMVTVDPLMGPFTPVGLRALAPQCGLQACGEQIIGNQPVQDCTTCDVKGCSKVSFTGIPRGGDCPHPCPNKIRFRACGQDFMEFHAIITPNPPEPTFDPTTTPFDIQVVFGGNTIVNLNLPAGALQAQGDAFTYRDSNANNCGNVNPAIGFVKLARRDLPGDFRIDVQLYDEGLQATNVAAPGIQLDTNITVGGQTFPFPQSCWLQKAFGWQSNSIQATLTCP